MTTSDDQYISSLQEKILHLLEVFPFLSATMINIGIGSATSAKFWRPALQKLMQSCQVKETHITMRTPSSRVQTYRVYHLSKNQYPQPSRGVSGDVPETANVDELSLPNEG